MTPLQALQATLAGEHAAVYVYGVIGGQVSRSRNAALSGLILDAYDAHRDRRDRLIQLIAARHVAPVAAAPAYRTPDAVSTTAQCRAAARDVEERCTQLYGQLVGATTGADRRFAIAALVAGALDELTFGASAQDCPGLG